MPVTDEPHSAREKEGAERDRQTEGGEEKKRRCGGVGESRGHVNRYMLETQNVFIHAVMHREMVEVIGRGMWSLTIQYLNVEWHIIIITLQSEYD